MVDYDVILLDINMAGMGGLATCRKVFQIYPRIPVIILSVRDDEEDEVEALDAGAHDYITKPFQVRELTARLRAAIRSSRTSPNTSYLSLIIGDLVLYPERRRLERSGEEIRLTPKEFELVRFLMEHAGRPVSHHRLLVSIWGAEYGNEREYLRVLISQLRKKIEDDPSTPAYILTESHIGYRFREV